MKELKSIHFLAAQQPVVATVGMFDGVHRGHRALIEYLLQRAEALNATAAVLSFWPHPRHLLETSHSPSLLSTEEERSELLSKTGLPHLITLPFNESLAAVDKDTFIEDILIHGIGVRHLIVGPHHRFGKGGAGTISDLSARAARGDFSAEAYAPVQIDGTRVSSTAIRSALAAADLRTAHQLLGYAYTFSALVVRGQQVGRSIGFPTANLKPSPDKLIPAEGVYAVEVQVSDRWLQGMLYIGRKSINQQTTHTIEVHIFKFDADLYGQTLKIRLHSYLRASKYLPSKQSLSEQLKIDALESLRILNA